MEIKNATREDGIIALNSALKKGTVKIKFTKVDGTIREMKATLSESIVPPAEGEAKRTIKGNDSVVKVYDVEAQGWRSFRKESLISWQLSQV